jgi:hypothetical protein
MTIFIQDTSTQTTGNITANQRYTTLSTPNISFNGSSGIYNPSLNIVKIFTNNTDALTIDSSQILTGNGGGLTNINYSNVINKPTYFQADWNSTIINKPTIPATLTFSSPLVNTANTIIKNEGISTLLTSGLIPRTLYFAPSAAVFYMTYEASRKYFNEVFAWNYLKISEEKKKDIAITFAKSIVQVRKKFEDISSVSKIENYLMNFKNLFLKDAYI